MASQTAYIPINRHGATNTHRVPINSATAEELVQRLDLTEREARAIVQSRPYRNPGELIERDVLSFNTFKRIEHRVTVLENPKR